MTSLLKRTQKFKRRNHIYVLCLKGMRQISRAYGKRFKREVTPVAPVC